MAIKRLYTLRYKAVTLILRRRSLSMNTLQMQCFLSIAENRSFSRTARELYVSQPTLTKHIQHLENELQVLLFDRSKHPIELTGYGELYYQAFSDFFGELKHIRQISLKHNDSFKGTLNIVGSFLPLSSKPLPHFVKYIRIFSLHLKTTI